MGKFIIKKENNFTSITNKLLQDKNLSCAAKGLLVYMLSLPEDWNYSISGLESCLKEGKKAIRTMLKELQDNGYLVIEKTNGYKGRYEYNYIVYEEQQKELSTLSTPDTPKGDVVEGDVVRGTQQNNNKTNNKITKGVHSTHNTLTQSQKDYLLNKYDKNIVNKTIELSKLYKNCYNLEIIEKWIIEDTKKQSKPKNRFNNFKQRQYTSEEWNEVEKSFFI